MLRRSTLLLASEVEKQSIFKQYEISEAQFEENIDNLCEWIKKTSLPIEENCRSKFQLLLLNNKMSLEKTKRTIESYYRIRTTHASIYDRLLPNTDDYKKVKKLMKTIVMPKLTPDLCRMTINKLSDPDGEAIDGVSYFIVALMMAEVRFMDSDYFLSNIVIIDCEGVQLKHFMKYTPSITLCLSRLASAISLRLKNAHFVNMPTAMDHFMTMVKAIMPSKYINKICIHKNVETLHEYIPKEYLPSDYEGGQPSIDELYDKWCEELERREEDFQKLLRIRASVSEPTDDRDTFEIGCGGSFKKLNID